jgi:hypothetical protein
MVADYSVAGIGVASGGKFDLTQLAADAGFTLASNEITLPTTGIYVISFSALVACSLTTNPRTVDVEVSDGSGSFYGMVNTRFSASASDGVLVAATWFGRCTNTSNHVKVVSAVSNLSIIAGGDGEGRLSIHRLRQSA